MSYTDDLYKEIRGMDALDVSAASSAQPAVERAQVDIVVTRDTNTIAQPLPFALFARQFLASGYQNFLEVPSGLTVDVETGMTTPVPADYGKLKFTYTDGVNTDIITVTANGSADYPALIEGTLSDIMQLSRMRIGISDSTLLAQFNTSLKIKSKSIFGASREDSISQTAYKSPQQFQSGIIDIDIKSGLDKETGIHGTIIDEPAFSVTFSLFISRFKKLNRKLL